MTTRKHLILALGTALAFLFLLPHDASRASWCDGNALLVRFDRGAVTFPEQVDYGHNAFKLSIEAAEFHTPELGAAVASLGVEAFETVAPAWRHLTDSDRRDRHGRCVELVDFTDVYRITLDASYDLDYVISALRQLPGVAYAECDDPVEFLFEPVDEYYDLQWHLHNEGGTIDEVQCDSFYDINAPQAWDIWDSAGTKIGIIDSGIHKDHEDLCGRIDEDLSRSFADTLPGYGWFDWWEMCDHGTKCAGMAAATADNPDSVGIAGVANLDPTHDDFVLVALKIGSQIMGQDSISTKASRVVKALAWVCSTAVYDSILVVNMSIETGPRYKNCHTYGTVLRDAARNAFYMDVSLVCASGNGVSCGEQTPCEPEPDTCFAYPAAYLDYSFAVTGIDCRGEDCMAGQDVASYIDITAPGWGIVTTRWHPQEGNDLYTGVGECARSVGTSFAAPQVAGAIALLIGREPSMTNEDCYRLLEITASDLDGYTAAQRGHGLMRVDSALAAITWPRVLRHDSLTTYDDVTLVDERSQAFRNVSGLAPRAEEWDTVWVEVHEVEASIHKLWPYPVVSIDTVWARGKHCTGWKNLAAYDAQFHAEYARFTGYYDVDEPDGAIFKTYTYKAFEDDTKKSFLGWYPFEPGEDPFRVHYSFLMTVNVDSLGMAPPPGRSILSFAPVSSVCRGGNVLLRLQLGRAGDYTVAVFDAQGRVARMLLDREALESGKHDIMWDGRDDHGRTVASGVYFPMVWQGPLGRDSERERTRVVLLR